MNNNIQNQKINPSQQAILDGLVNPDQDEQEKRECFARNDWEFANDVLSILIRVPRYMMQFGKLVEPAHFEDKGHRWIWQCVKDLYNQYGVLPEKNTIMREIKKRHQDSSYIYAFLGGVEALFASPVVDGHTAQYLADTLENFIRQSRVRKIVSKTIDLAEKGKWDEAVKYMTEASSQSVKVGGHEVPSILDYIARGQEQYQWIIPGKLRAGVLVILGADSKMGKTTLIYNTFQDLLCEGFAWGEVCEPVPVIHLDFESDPTFIKNNMFKVRDFTDEQYEVMGKYFRATDYLDPDPARCLPSYLSTEYLDEIISKFDKPGIIIPDTLRGAFAGAGPDVTGKDKWDHDASAVRKLLNPFSKWCHKTGWTILFLAHTNKSGDLYGSVDFRAVADQLVTMEREKDREGKDTGYSIVKITGRMAACPPLRFRFNQFYSFEGVQESSAKKQASKELVEMLELFKDGPLTVYETMELTGLTEYKVRRLVNDGLVEKKLALVDEVETGGKTPAKRYGLVC